MRGFLIGTLALVALEVFLDTSHGDGPGAAGRLLGWAQSGLAQLADPTVPGLPRRGAHPKATTAAGASPA